MITKELISRINELARKSKDKGLTDDEKVEQADLRKEYIRCFRENFRKQLECIELVDEPSDCRLN